MVYSHWLSPGPGQGLGPEPGRMGCMILRRTFHTAPEQEQGRMGYVPIFRSWNCFRWCEWFLHKIGPHSSLGPGDSQCEYTIILTLTDTVPVTYFITNLHDSQSVMAHLDCWLRTQLQTRTKIWNLMATLYCTETVPIVQTRTKIPTPYFCIGQESQGVK